MATDFPNSPSLNQIFTDPTSGKSWVWDGEKWASTDSTSNQFLVQTGMVMAWPASDPPAGWLLCNGGSYLRTQHPALYATILTTYGVGSSTNSTTFNVPDLRNRFPAGIGTSAWSNTLNQKSGNPDAVVVSHQHSISHSHTGSVSGGSHTHRINHGHTSSVGGTGVHIHSGKFLTQGFGSGIYDFGRPYNNIAGTTQFLKATDGDGHSHAFSITTHSGSSGFDDPHTHSPSIGGSDTANSGIVADNLGASATNANLPPYIVLNYIIKT